MKVFALLKLSAINYNTANYSPVFKQDEYDVLITLQELMAGGNGYMVAANILATDADGDILTYSIFTAENDPFGLLSSSSSTIIYIGQSVSTGTYSYYITAVDNHGASAYAEVNIHVIDELNDPRTENTPPEIVLDDQDGIYEPDTDGYVTITGHLVDATNYSTTYGSTYELKLFDVDDNKLEPIDYIINEDLTFTMSIDMRGYEVGDVQLKLKATEKIMNLPPAKSQVAMLNVNVENAVEKKSITGTITLTGEATSSAEKGKFTPQGGMEIESTNDELQEDTAYNKQYDGSTEFKADYTINFKSDGSIDTTTSKITLTNVHYTYRNHYLTRDSASVSAQTEADLIKIGKSVYRNGNKAYIYKKPTLEKDSWKTLSIPITEVSFKDGKLQSFKFKGDKWYGNPPANLIDKGIIGEIDFTTRKASFTGKIQNADDGVISTYVVSGTIK